MVHRFFKSQLNNRNKKYWVTTVLGDFKYLDLEDLSMEMEKEGFMKRIKQGIKKKHWKNLKKEISLKS